MKFKYRMISEERCKEIDSWEIRDPYGYGKIFTAEKIKFVTNMDESILFCHTFSPRHDDREGNHESYLFVMDKEYHMVNHIVKNITVSDELNWIVYVNILENDFIDNCDDKVMSILKKVISVFVKKFRRETPGEHFEYHFYYRGEEV